MFPTLAVLFEESLQFILSDVDTVLASGCIETQEYIDMYTRIYEFCTDITNVDFNSQKPNICLKVAEMLFVRIKDFVYCWIMREDASFNLTVDDPRLIIENYISKWNHFHKCITIIDRAGFYITRSFLEKDHVRPCEENRSIYNSLASIWCHKIYRPRSQALFEIIFVWLDNIRTNNTPNMTLIDDFLLSIYQLGYGDAQDLDPTNDFLNTNTYEDGLVFNKDFFEPFIEKTQSYYTTIAEKFWCLPNFDVMKYTVMIADTCNREINLMRKSLTEQNRIRLMGSIDKALVDSYRDLISTEFYRRLYNNDLENSKLLLSILFRQSDCVGRYRENFEGYVIGYGNFLYNNMDKNITNKNVFDFLRNIYSTYKNLIYKYLPNMEGLIPILVYALAELCNLRSKLISGLNMNKVLAKIIHKKITRIIDGDYTAQPESEITDAILFMYLTQNREEFYSYYAKYFEKRFFEKKNFNTLLEKTVFYNIEKILVNPKALLNDNTNDKTYYLVEGSSDKTLRQNFFSIVPWLLNPGLLSIVEFHTLQNLKNYVEYALQTFNSCQLEVNKPFQVFLFEQATWLPFECIGSKFKLLQEYPVIPEALSRWNSYSENFRNENPDKKLHLLCDKSTVALIYKSLRGKFKLELSLYQVIVFIELTKANYYRMEYDKLLEKTRIYSINLSQTIYQLYNEDLLIVIRQNSFYKPLKNYELHIRDVIQLNDNFYTDKDIVITKRKLKDNIEEYGSEFICGEKEKSFLIQCIAVNLLKKENTVDANEFILKVQKELKGRFVADFALIKSCLVDLEKKDYLRFNEENCVYTYYS